MTTRKFTPEEIALIHRTYMEGAKADDVALFIATCERTGLDPFARHIMPSSRNTQKNGQWVTVWTWIVTIDGLRKIAVDSGDYEGQEGPWWCGPDGVWKEVWSGKDPCFAAKVLVHRRGFRTGLSGIAKYDSYVQKKRDGLPNSVWTNLGDHMTAKCAEALALRRAYPNEMAGLYTDDEEMALEPSHEALKPTTPTTPSSTPEAWDIDSESEFITTLDRAYIAFKAGIDDPTKGQAEYEKFAAKCKGRKVEPAEKVLTEMAAYVEKLENAAKAKAEKLDKAS